jgi:PTH1 family peptidyl-tRNA hydrolase
MFLFVGIGNIGKEYWDTRHNVGFMLVDKMIEKFNFIERGKKWHSQYWTGNINFDKVIIIKPQTFVNESGIAVLDVANFYKIELNNIYVFHDDMDLILGKIKYKIGGSSAGHNGIKNIDSKIGKEYNRIRIGIGKPNYKDDTINHVLGKFHRDDKIIINEMIDKVIDNIDFLLNNKQIFQTNIAKIENK